MDVPSGVWDYMEYEKLRPYDAETFRQPFEAFACHATPGSLCNGWAVCHSNRGHQYSLVALRILGVDAPVVRQMSMLSIPLFESGDDAADWGQQNIDDPDEDAVRVMERLKRKYPRLRDSDDTEVSHG
jgi:hypothetical protein